MLLNLFTVYYTYIYTMNSSGRCNADVVQDFFFISGSSHINKHLLYYQTEKICIHVAIPWQQVDLMQKYRIQIKFLLFPWTHSGSEDLISGKYWDIDESIKDWFSKPPL